MEQGQQWRVREVLLLQPWRELLMNRPGIAGDSIRWEDGVMAARTKSAT